MAPIRNLRSTMALLAGRLRTGRIEQRILTPLIAIAHEFTWRTICQE
jgi:hypothetical protein